MLRWPCEFDTADPQATNRFYDCLKEYPLQARSFVLLRPDLPITSSLLKT